MAATNDVNIYSLYGQDGISSVVLQDSPVVMFDVLTFGSADGITDLSIDSPLDVAKYDTINGRPLIRAVGGGLRKVSFTLNLVNAFGVDVDKRIGEIKDLQGKVGVFFSVGNAVGGNGNVFFAIMTTIREQYVRKDGYKTAKAVLNIELTECDTRKVIEVKRVDTKVLTNQQKKQKRQAAVVAEPAKKQEEVKQMNIKLAEMNSGVVTNLTHTYIP